MLKAIHATLKQHIEVSILTRPRWAGAQSPCRLISSARKFQSSPARGGRVLPKQADYGNPGEGFNPHPPEVGGCSCRNRQNHCAGVCFNPHPPEVGGCSLLPDFDGVNPTVSILTRPRWAGALIQLVKPQPVIQFQSSPARGGRVLAVDPRITASRISFNPHPPEVGGCSLSDVCNHVDYRFQSSPARGGRVLSICSLAAASIICFNPHPPEVGGCSAAAAPGETAVPVSILTRPRWAGARVIGKITQPGDSFNPHPPEVGGCSAISANGTMGEGFQSSPARGGRVLLMQLHINIINTVSILTRPRWAGAQGHHLH